MPAFTANAQKSDEITVATGWVAPQTPDYTASLDAVAHTGRHSMSLHATGPSSGDFFVRQRIRADRWRGKKVRLAGWLKLDHTERGAALWLRVDMANGDYILDGALELAARPGWTRAELVAEVPTDAIGISFGVRMKGGGQVWADDLSITEAPASARTTTIERRKYPASPGREASIAGMLDAYRRSPLQPVNLNFESR